MIESEQFEDWRIRYDHVHRKRYTKGQKQRFLRSFTHDLMLIRKDISLRKDKQDKNSFHIVVGDLKKAKTVIATYYDTPAIYSGDYFFFDYDRQKNAITIPIIINSIIMLLAGILLTYFFSIPLFEGYGFSWRIMLMFLVYFVFFLIFGRVTQGWPSRHTIIRNNSSVLFLLDYINAHPESDFAYVFYDNGVQGNNSIQKVANKLDVTNQQLVLLDSVGAKGFMTQVVSNKLKNKLSKSQEVLFSDLQSNIQIILVASNEENKAKKLYLRKSDLKTSDLNEENYRILTEYFSKIERGENK